MDGFSWFSAIRFGTDMAWMLAQSQHGIHLFVTFWNNGAHGPISDFFTHVGHTSVHIIKDTPHGIAHVFCKGRQIEVPVTKNGVDISSCR